MVTGLAGRRSPLHSPLHSSSHQVVKQRTSHEAIPATVLLGDQSDPDLGAGVLGAGFTQLTQSTHPAAKQATVVPTKSTPAVRANGNAGSDTIQESFRSSNSGQGRTSCNTDGRVAPSKVIGNPHRTGLNRAQSLLNMAEATLQRQQQQQQQLLKQQPMAEALQRKLSQQRMQQRSQAFTPGQANSASATPDETERITMHTNQLLYKAGPTGAPSPGSPGQRQAGNERGPPSTARSSVLGVSPAEAALKLMAKASLVTAATRGAMAARRSSATGHGWA